MGGIEEGETLPEERQADGVALLVGGKDDVAGFVSVDIHGPGKVMLAATLKELDARTLPTLAAWLPGFRVEEGEHLDSPLAFHAQTFVRFQPRGDIR